MSNSMAIDLADRAAALMEKLGYKETTVKRFRGTWRNIVRFCEEHGLREYGPEEEGLYLEARGLTGEGLSRRQVDELRQAKTLLAAGGEGVMPPRRPWREGIKVPERFVPAYEAYRLHLEGRGLRPATVASNLKVVKGFLAGLDARELADVRASDVTTHVERVGSGSPQVRALVLYDTRAFARWASGEGLMDPAVAASMPVIPDHSRSKLPSAYSPAEVAAAVGAPGTECPRRNRAMMLLASVLGLRAGDIRALRTSDFDWARMTVTFTQRKTGKPVILPVPEEVALAVADYLANERPESSDPHVFLHARAPHDSLESSPTSYHNSFHHVTSGAFERAGVDVGGRRRGMHSLRHSAATAMLASGTPYPVISSVLGHSDTNVTRRYLAIDVERLRRLSLEVPRG